ncbi:MULTISPECIES: glycosyltransferase family 2 protein [Microcystis]|jgi:glycosyltransferase involved in cell wall biosynthesis|uniref:Glycosyl transferase family 2 n=1 Tax=Microcystis aeruginosa PCC 9701 TaxID=721123 RepID=I4IQY4_MICAE|nr:glycosyltransferase family 2 protein [Microcystis aeruginosa]CCI36708.1 Glycosyl transferase family 2 [Microcystis aeruginosa PCC 9701]
MTFIPDQQPLVSVLIPTYQGEEFLEEALDSVLSQTYHNLEIIISDDGSVDRTLEIAKNFQLQFSRKFKILTHQRLGMIPNWNFCLSMAQGKYIKFLFQDDVLTATCIKDMVQLAESDEDIGLVFSARALLTAGGVETNDTCLNFAKGIENIHLAWSKLESIQSGINLLSDPKFLDGSINKIGEPSTVLIRKNVFDTLGDFDPSLCQLVDVDMWCRIMLQYKVGFINKTLSYFRVHFSQQTVQNNEEGKITNDYQFFLHKMMTNPCYNNIPPELKKRIYLKVENERDDFQRQLVNARKRIQYLEEREIELETQRKNLDSLVEEFSGKLQTAEALIIGMESSKFWKLRMMWRNLRHRLGLPDND